MLYFIFEKNTILKKETYIFLAKKYYKNSLFLSRLFLDIGIINNDAIEKEKILEYIKNNYRQDLENYIEDVTEYASACIELSILAAEEAKHATLEAIAAQQEYDEKYGNEE